MPILNGQGVISYARTMSRGAEGQVASTKDLEVYTVANPKNKQVSTVAVGGTAADATYSITVTEPDGTAHTFSVVRSTTPATNADIGAALRTAGQALASLKGVAVVTGATTNVIITFDHEGIDYVVTNSVSAGTGTLTTSSTVASSGTALPFGRFVVDGGASEDGQRKIALPGASAAAGDILGVLLRDLRASNGEALLTSDTDKLPAGKLGSVAYEGHVLMKNVSDVAAAKGGAVYIVVNTAGGDEAGACRSDADGSNTVVPGARLVRWDEDTAAGALGMVLVRL